MEEVFDDLQVTLTGGVGFFMIGVVGIVGVKGRAGVAVVVFVFAIPVPGSGGEYLPYGLCLGVNLALGVNGGG